MTCAYCEEEIKPGEEAPHVFGDQFHKECLFRMTAGSLGHQKKLCTCYGGKEGDPAGLTKRQAAQAALTYWQEQHPEHAHQSPN